MTRHDLKVLLVQFRDDDMKAHEVKCLLEFSNLHKSQLHLLDALKDDVRPGMIEDHDLVMLGGSGGYCVSEESIPSLPDVYELMRTAKEHRKPALGICFGAHVMTVAFGGEIEHKSKDQETGSFQIRLNEHGANDPIFSNLPGEYWAQMGHKDFITRLPEGAVNMASSDRAHHQAWKFADVPMYAIQFHPELTKEGLTERVLYYLDKYVGDDANALQRILDTAKSSDEATKVLSHFLDHALEWKLKSV